MDEDEDEDDSSDRHGDHPHTNFHGMYDALRERGYYLEILGSPLTCFDAKVGVTGGLFVYRCTL